MNIRRLDRKPGVKNQKNVDPLPALRELERKARVLSVVYQHHAVKAGPEQVDAAVRGVIEAVEAVTR